jgi:hypothetical protein
MAPRLKEYGLADEAYEPVNVCSVGSFETATYEPIRPKNSQALSSGWDA